MGFFSRKVAVTFIDDATGEVFARTKMAPEDLPESFDLETTLQAILFRQGFIEEQRYE